MLLCELSSLSNSRIHTQVLTFLFLQNDYKLSLLQPQVIRLLWHVGFGGLTLWLT